MQSTILLILPTWAVFSLSLSLPPQILPISTLGTLCKARRQRQRERRQTKGLMRKTIAVHVHYKSLYISLPSSAKQQIAALPGEREPQRLIFRLFYLKPNAFVAYSAGASFNAERHTE